MTARDDVLELDRLLAEANPLRAEDLPEPTSLAAAALYARTFEPTERLPGGRRRVAARRRTLAFAVAALVLLVVGGAVAAVGGVPWWHEGKPPANPEVVERQLVPHEGGLPPAADRARARTVARAKGAALVAAPVGESGYCLIPSLAGSPDIGFSCTYSVENPARGLGDEFRSYARPPADGEPRWIIYGRITDPRARLLDLSDAAGGPLRVALSAGGFFLAEIPKERWSELANTAGQGLILDHSGGKLRSGCVSWGPSPHDKGAGESRWGFWSEGAGPCDVRTVPTRPTLLFDQAERLVAMRLREKHSVWDAGTTIALWRAPTLQGGECLYVGLDRAPGGRVDGLPGLPGAGSCTFARPMRTPEQPLTADLSWTRQGPHDYSVLIKGYVKMAERTARVVLRTPAGEEELAYGNGFYLGQLPSSSTSANLPDGGPHTVVAHDANGREVATLDLEASLQKLQGG